MNIQVKRIYEESNESDGFRILVDRLWPRGIKKTEANIDLWLKDIAPSDSLRKWFNHDPKKWTEFQKRYAQEITDKQEDIDIILDEGKKKKVTLLFGSKETEHNNAVALLNILLTKI
ncbi:TPA: DUF488 domain-containing protein [Legionella pneumophila]|uniref:Uroporphyrin-III C-methyltransferase n=2 Tax=Legionella TaxID=445 RepID=A0A364LGC1_9GAMM|nr:MULTISPECIES: DUF488 domain-containing protein [Legionella]AMQ28698.1 uroporphyrin-III methyltransferase [Legionella pneumophila subsp. pneumophila]KTD40804.1 uroporphyrin-III C- methyltransferase [Legionella parisiensis]PQM71047.1 DUF488 domain-containing protein [Legionella pneumophila]PYB42159.1 DUF488 domain-containing protein [Legionella pneumophila]PYB45939.1 DUF488 domain-containing protein [Legionella pneumophila]